jgi:hypothetical protein
MLYGLEEYRRPVEVDGQLILVGIIFALAAKLSALRVDCNFPAGSLYVVSHPEFS